MTKPIPACEPKAFVAGDTVQWTKSLADYAAADGWTLKYRLVIGKTYTADSATNPESYLVTIPAADTAGIVADTVTRLIGWVEKDAEKYTVFDAMVSISANARTANATQIRTHEEKVLEAIEATLEGRAGSDMAAYQIKDRQVTKMTVEELLRWRGVYAGIVWKQRNPGTSFPTHAARMRAAR